MPGERTRVRPLQHLCRSISLGGGQKSRAEFTRVHFCAVSLPDILPSRSSKHFQRLTSRKRG
jgi:hypothetical protein